MKWIDKIRKHVKSKEFFKFLRGLFLIFTALFFTIIMIIVYILEAQPNISFTALSFTLLSLAIASHAVIIAIESDEKMKSIATGDFFNLTNKFWDRAPKLYQDLSQGARDTQSWQLGNLFRHAEKLKKWAEPDVQERLIKEFKIFLERLRPTPCKKYWVEIKNYRTTCNTAMDFITNNDNIKNMLILELSNWLGEKKKEESNKAYLQRKSREFSNKKDNEVFTYDL